MRGDLGGMMKQFQQMQAKMEAMQAELEQTEVEGSAGGGMVHVTMNGKHEVLGVTIDPSVVDKDDVEMLQDLIKAAASQAHQKVQDLQAERMSGITGGLNLPPGMGLPF